MTTMWNDIADQLTPQQCAELAAYGDDKPGALLIIARGFAAENLAAAVLSDLPAPAGALATDDWERTRDGWQRHFSGASRRVGEATVTIHGMQSSDELFSRWLHVRDDDSELSPPQARELAAALHGAADEIDHVSDSEG